MIMKSVLYSYLFPLINKDLVSVHSHCCSGKYLYPELLLEFSFNTLLPLLCCCIRLSDLFPLLCFPPRRHFPIFNCRTISKVKRSCTRWSIDVEDYEPVGLASEKPDTIVKTQRSVIFFLSCSLLNRKMQPRRSSRSNKYHRA